MKLNKGVVFACVALAAQVAAVGGLVWRYERVVAFGEEVRMKCRAYDPYDPLRGRYLSMTVSETCTNILFEVDMSRYWTEPECAVFAKLAKAPEGELWHVEAVAREPSGDGLWVKPSSVRMDYLLEYDARGKDEPYEEFDKRRKASGIKAEVRFPDQLFVNEKIAPAAEKLMQKKSGSAVAVFRALDGRIVLTGVEIDGKPVQSATRDAMNGDQSAK